MSGKRDELLTVDQVLEALGGISRRTFYRWREIGKAPAGSSSRTARSASTAAISTLGSGPYGRRRRELVLQGQVLGDQAEQGWG